MSQPSQIYFHLRNIMDGLFQMPTDTTFLTKLIQIKNYLQKTHQHLMDENLKEIRVILLED